MSLTIASFPNHQQDDLPYIEHCVAVERTFVRLGATRGVETISEQQAIERSWQPPDHLCIWVDNDDPPITIHARDLRPRMLSAALRVALEGYVWDPNHANPVLTKVDPDTGEVGLFSVIGSSSRTPVRPSDLVWRGAPILAAEPRQVTRPAPRRRLTRPERDLLIVKLHGQGERVIKIARRAECSTSTVYNVLRRAKVNDR